MWELLTVEYEFRADELVMLVELCALADDLAGLRRALKGAPFTVAGSKGQPVTNPLRAELHRTSTRYESLARALGISEAEEGTADKSMAGRKLARARWG